MVYKNTS